MKFVQIWTWLDWLARCPSAIKSLSGQGGGIADVIPVVLCQFGFSSCVSNCDQALQANGVERAVSISSMREEGRKRENHLAASLLVRLKRSPMRMRCLSAQMDATSYSACYSEGFNAVTRRSRRGIWVDLMRSLASSIENHAPRSASGISIMRPDRGGHSISQ